MKELSDVQRQAIGAIRDANLVVCLKADYPEVRKAMQDFAGYSIDAGDVLRATIALEEVKRLDKQHNFS